MRFNQAGQRNAAGRLLHDGTIQPGSVLRHGLNKRKPGAAVGRLPVFR
jgi:hypothetical protein